MVLEGGHPAPSEWPSCEISNQAVKLAARTSDLDRPAAVSHEKDSLFLVETCTTHNASTCQTSDRQANLTRYYHTHYPPLSCRQGCFLANEGVGWARSKVFFTLIIQQKRALLGGKHPLSPHFYSCFLYVHTFQPWNCSHLWLA